MGIYYQYGQLGVKRDPEKAANYFKKAISLNEQPAAYYELANMLRFSKNANKREHSLELMLKSAHLNCKSAQKTVVGMLFTKIRMEEAYFWLHVCENMHNPVPPEVSPYSRTIKMQLNGNQKASIEKHAKVFIKKNRYNYTY